MEQYFAQTDAVPDSYVVLCLLRVVAEVGNICLRSLNAASGKHWKSIINLSFSVK